VFSTLIVSWFEEQRVEAEQRIRRIIETEEWEAMQGTAHSTSPVDVFRMLTTVVDQFWGFVPHDRDKFCAIILQNLGEAMRMYVNLLTDVVVEATPLWMPKFPLDAKLGRSRADSRADEQASELAQDVVQACDLLAARDMYKSLIAHWQACVEEHDGSLGDAYGLEALSSFIDQEFIDAIGPTVGAIGAKVAYYYLAPTFIESLYIVGSETTMEGVVEDMGSIVQEIRTLACGSAMGEALAASAGASALQVFERVLFDGGPRRMFSMNALPMLVKDLEQVITFSERARDRLVNSGGLKGFPVKPGVQERLRHLVMMFSVPCESLTEYFAKLMDGDQDGVPDHFTGELVLKCLEHRDEPEAKTAAAAARPVFNTKFIPLAAEAAKAGTPSKLLGSARSLGNSAWQRAPDVRGRLRKISAATKQASVDKGAEGDEEEAIPEPSAVDLWSDDA